MGFQKGFREKTLCPIKKQRQRVAVATPDWALASRLSVETNGRNSMIATLLHRDDKWQNYYQILVIYTTYGLNADSK